ncbi:DUF6703 family protein [Stackebrandtia soli]|uniref:DUF6703 family protein n=1 Tax=Stackebrandtia soli TaxID=1892856 RepID=UPI0039EC4E99
MFTVSDKGTTATTPDQSTGGEAPSEATARLLQWLERLPKIAVFASVLVITVGILMTPGPAGGVLTLILAGGSGFLVYATWRRQTATATRLARVLVVIALTALAIGKLLL